MALNKEKSFPAKGVTGTYWKLSSIEISKTPTAISADVVAYAVRASLSLYKDQSTAEITGAIPYYSRTVQLHLSKEELSGDVFKACWEFIKRQNYVDLAGGTDVLEPGQSA